MSRKVPMDRALSDEDRAYLHSRGKHSTVAMLDARYGKKAMDSDPVVPSDEDDADYDNWTAAELREELSERGLATTGNKAEMTARLREDDAKS